MSGDTLVPITGSNTLHVAVVTVLIDTLVPITGSLMSGENI